MICPRSPPKINSPLGRFSLPMKVELGHPAISLTKSLMFAAPNVLTILSTVKGLFLDRTSYGSSQSRAYTSWVPVSRSSSGESSGASANQPKPASVKFFRSTT